MLQKGLQSAQRAYEAKLEEEKAKEKAKEVHHQNRADKVNSIRMHRGLYLSVGSNSSGKTSIDGQQQYTLSHTNLFPKRSHEWQQREPDSPRFLQRKKIFNGISTEETIRISSYTIHKALDQLRRHWRVSQTAREVLGVPPRFIGRNRAIQHLQTN